MKTKQKLLKILESKGETLAAASLGYGGGMLLSGTLIGFMYQSNPIALYVAYTSGAMGIGACVGLSYLNNKISKYTSVKK